MARGRTAGKRSEPLDHWGSLRQTLVTLTADVGQFPTLNDLERRGRFDVMRALVRHGGSAAVAARLQRDLDLAQSQVAAASAAAAPVDSSNT